MNMMSKFNYLITLILGSVLFLSCKMNTVEKEIEHKFTNSLINETSPYLLQHAHNPVDWRTWSTNALEEAKKENKLVLVSIGYSSCHWCHVMEEETFEDEAVAQIMNDNFINIKVDREERPDVDHIYQTAIELINGTGGWPLNAIVLPNGKPIYLSTYHTKEQWSTVLSRFSEQYVEDAEKMEAYADMLAQGIQDVNLIESSTNLDGLTQDLLKESVENWKRNWDLEWGGDVEVEKFIIPTKLEFLLDYAILTGDESAKKHVKFTLDKIAMGGIYDHVEGGFFRYSTDSYWKVPHFEKMLYDNAQLLSLYSKAYKVFEEPLYKEIVLETFTFMEQKMKSPEAGYYAAIDANSEGEEGKFYLWNEDDLKSIIQEDFELFAKYFNITSGQAWKNGDFVLHKKIDDHDFIKQQSISKEELDVKKSKWKKLLFDHREQRKHPNIDDKIITSWNSLAINGLLEAYKTFGQKEFLTRAEEVFEFINSKSLIKGQLIHSYKKEGRHVDGFLEDYALVVNAALNLYSTTLNEKYLDFTLDMNQTAYSQFDDQESDLFRYSKNDELISKIIRTIDGFWPSSNSVMAHNLHLIGHIQYNKEFLDKSKTMLSSMASNMEEYGQNYSNWNALLLNSAYPYYEIAVVGKNALPLVKELHEQHIPNILVVGSLDKSDLPLFEGRYIEEGTLVYVCQNSTCKLPVETIEEAIDQMQNF